MLVRAGVSLGREGALRVTVGTAAENERFVGALGELLRMSRALPIPGKAVMRAFTWNSGLALCNPQPLW